MAERLRYERSHYPFQGIQKEFEDGKGGLIASGYNSKPNLIAYKIIVFLHYRSVVTLTSHPHPNILQCLFLFHLSRTAMEEALVLYPSPPIGHLVSMVELGKLILTRRPSLSIHILIAASPYVAGKADKYMATVSANFPSIDFHHLPTVTPVSTTVTHHEELTLESSSTYPKGTKVHGLVMDFFCSSGLSVANELDIPGYFFLTSGACFLAFFLHLPTLHQKTSRSFKDMKDQYLDIPGLPSILATDMPNPFLDRDNQAYQHFLDFSTQFPQASGIMINTFELLESKVIRAISDGLCVPNNRTPPISCIGPLILGAIHQGTVMGNSYRAGKKWPKVLVGGSEPTFS
ncbi:hypothetical protein OIU84_028622 [Salix udensis]|uniref:Uncharacterized protein n=1 Tax=Salix udensis TaxID=889485 RepID=A0AAD6KD06_9ROSI|nr:hypothetical protein OIU84_028622 [Salix udensis]